VRFGIELGNSCLEILHRANEKYKGILAYCAIAGAKLAKFWVVAYLEPKTEELPFRFSNLISWERKAS
jgi:hypothetical protein